MRLRPLFWFLVSMVCFIGAFYFWRLGDEWNSKKAKAPAPVESRSDEETVVVQSEVKPASTSPMALMATANTNAASGKTNRMAYRLSNTSKSLKQLGSSDQAILLENALIDTSVPVNLAIPDEWKSKGDPGTYLVQARGPADDAFRARLQNAGATIISYFPNNAYLVRASADVANSISGVQCVLPWEPYYKVAASLLQSEKPLTADQTLNVLLFADAAESGAKAMVDKGGRILGQSRSPFGTLITVSGLNDLHFIAAQPAVQIIEPATPRQPAVDLTRQSVGVASDSVAPTNYMGLSGANVLVGVVDTGIDSTHDALSGRVFGFSLFDTNGHGTHVAGIIAGNGAHSDTVTNASGSIMPPVDGQFRGMATNASLFALPINDIYSDLDLQETVARTNALISNNSWGYSQQTYDIAAASYDAAVRDALPGVTGSQPVVFVFAAGNSGNGSDSGSGVSAGSILSPATAKNVITVGALEQLRNITNETETVRLGTTNKATPWVNMTDSDSEVARFSSRGNVGVNVEGEFGRFKPDVVAPGVFVVSTRSGQWDEEAYYNPTNYHSNTFIEQTRPGLVHGHSLFLPYNTVEPVNVRATAIFPEIDLPIYYRRAGGFPTLTTYDLLRTNFLSLKDSDYGPVPATRFYGIANTLERSIRYEVTTLYATTNDNGNYFQVLSNMNNGLGQYYRYESGTSMAAPVVSGLLALMEDYFTNQLKTIASPALMKAMLINGARTVNASYDLQVGKTLNDQGWGLPNLTNSLPVGITNGTAGVNVGAAMLFFDQNPSNALATGQSRTFNITVRDDATNEPVRVTLVWTDPPGNPAASIKLVNDLDLIVTNLDDPANPIVYYGNDFPSGSSYTFPWDTNSVPSRDFVNNVENVFLLPPQGTNYSVTVFANKVNVNAVTAHTNNVAQDFALVISSGNGGNSNAIAITTAPVIVTNRAVDVTVVTNDFPSAPGVSGQILMNQHVGANPPLLSRGSVGLDANTVWGSGGTNGVITLGVSNQWHFYVITNTTTFTNAAFAVFLPPTLSIPRMGVTNYKQSVEATRVEADIDLYVSTDINLLALDPNAIAGADKSVGRKGTEFIVYTNSVQDRVYYVGVHCEDQQASEYAFLGMFSLLPFDDGNGRMNWFPLPAVIPDGTPDKPGGVTVFGINTTVFDLRRVVVTNNLTHERMDDLFGQLQHNGISVVLNNHSCVPDTSISSCRTNVNYIYEDNDENDIPGSQPTDGPGQLTEFIGEPAQGIWMLTMVDNAFGSTGVVNNVSVRLESQADLSTGLLLDIEAHSFRFASVDVPPEGTNLTICVKSNSQPLQLYVRRGDLPSLAEYDYTLAIPTGGDCLTIDKSSIPPLRTGRYYIGVYNPNAATVRAWLTAVVLLDTNGVPTTDFSMFGPQTIPDDAVSYSSINVPYDRQVARVDVDVAIQHPRISDMALTLLSPSGKRILLCENRGGTSSDMGKIVVTTNTLPSVSSGGQTASTNVIAITNSTGVLVIDFDFLQAPDTLDVYYGTTNIYSTGLISGKGNFSIPFGPGSATTLTIVVNKDSNPNNPGTAWQYSAQVITVEGSYFTFSENTNFTHIPIKFAVPPFRGPNSVVTNAVVFENGFENTPQTTVFSPGVVAGWSVTAGSVDVLSNGIFGGIADSGIQYLDINGDNAGTIITNFPTVVGKTYWLSFAYAKNPNAAVAQAQVNIGGTLINVSDNQPNSWANINWKHSMQVFTASSATTVLQVQSLTSGLSGVLFDSFKVQEQSPLVIMNDGFENGVRTGNPAPAGTYVSGWHVDSGNVDLLYPGYGFFGFPAEGSQALDLNGLTAGVISTNFVLIPGARYQLTFAYAKNPGGPAGYTASMDVALTGQPSLQFSYSSPNSYNSLNWSNASILFTATSPMNTLRLSSLVPSGSAGMYLDEFAVTAVPFTNGAFYFPEESLKDLQGDSAKGEWKLEMWDNRVGATNPAPQLVSWRLRFVFDEPVSPAVSLHHDSPVTNTLAPCQIAYYSVQVPSWAKFITNTLVSSTIPVNGYWNTNTLPGSGGTNAGDFPLFVPQPTTSRVTVLNAASVGGQYFLAIENPCSSTTNATFVFKVEFDTTALSNNVPVTSTNLGNNVPRYFYYDVSTNATAVSFSLTNMSGNFDLVVHRGGPLPPDVPYDYGSFNPGTLDEQIIVFTNSTPVPLAPGRWYIGVYNTSLASNVFTIVVSEYTNSFASLITLTNGIPYTNSAAAGGQQSYRYVVSSAALRAQFEINNPSGDMALVARKGLPLPDLSSYDYRSDNPFLNDELIVLLPGSTPVPLTPGQWFLTAVNLSGAPVNYSIKATEWQSTGHPITITHVGYTPPLGTNAAEFCITWSSLPGVHYFLQSIADLSTTNWAVASPTITAVDYTTTYCVPLGPGNEFFRVVEGLALSSAAPPQQFAILPAAGGFSMQWQGAASSKYQVQWTTNLAAPVWTAFVPTNMTSTNVSFTNGVYSFFDDGSQLGGPPPPSQVFYRILLLP